MSAEAVVLNPQLAPQSSILRTLLLRRPGWRLAILACSLASAILGILSPYGQKRFIDDLMRGSPGSAWVYFAFATALLAQAASQLSLWLSAREAALAEAYLGKLLYSRLLSERGGLVGRKGQSGSAVSLFAVDVSGAVSLLDQCLAMGVSMIFPLLLAPIAVHELFGIPTWESFAAIAALAALNHLLALKQSRYFYRFKQLAAERTSLVTEWVMSMRPLRILGWMTSIERRIFATRERETRNRLAMVTNGQIMNSIAGSSTFVLNLLAASLLVAQRGARVTPGELLALLWILGVFLARPLRQLPWFFVIGMDGLSSVRRLEAALAISTEPPRVDGKDSGPIAPALALEVSGLRLESADGKPLIRDIDLRLGERELVAIVGPVGSGKSLLLQSLIGETSARFSRYSVRGRETEGPSDPSVRGSFSFVPQEGFTMSATLRENVLFDYEVSTSRDLEALRSLEAAQFPPRREGLESGLDAEIGERGTNLSGGQRQRVGLARAHFSDRPIVLLDDCLSAVDVDTERKLLASLIRGDWEGQPRLLATHRMSVLPHCDRILFMENGRITLEGAFQDLLSRSAPFREFVREAGRAERESPAGVTSHA